jgi:hypothetical protein
VTAIASDKRLAPRLRQLYRLPCMARSNGKGDECEASPGLRRLP